LDETVDRLSWGQTQWALRGSQVNTGEGCPMGTIKIAVMDLIP